MTAQPAEAEDQYLFTSQALLVVFAPVHDAAAVADKLLSS
jgi:hypothetical protein